MVLNEIDVEDVVVLTNEQFPEGVVGHVRSVGLNYCSVLVSYIKKDKFLEEYEEDGDDGIIQHKVINAPVRFLELYPEPRFVRVLKKGDQVQIAGELLINFTSDMLDYLNRIVTIDYLSAKGDNVISSDSDKPYGFRILEDNHESFWNIENVDVSGTNRLLMKKEGTFTSIQNPKLPMI